MKLYKLLAGIYTGKIKTYNTRRSNRTGLTYLRDHKHYRSRVL